MPDDTPPLRPADRAEVLHSLSYALRHGRTTSRQGRDDLVARLPHSFATIGASCGTSLASWTLASTIDNHPDFVRTLCICYATTHCLSSYNSPSDLESVDER